jgi:hypothetical protein
MADADKQQKGLDLTQIISAGAQGLVANANRLGLTWTLHLGTIRTTVGDDVFVEVDGDTQQMVCKTMVGPVGPSQRVFVLAIPPGGMFIVGFAGTNRIGCSLARVSPQSINNAVVAQTQYDTVTYDPIGMWQRANPTVVTIPITGVWAATHNTQLANPATGRSLCSINVTPPGGTSRIYRSFWSVGEQFISVTISILMVKGTTLVTDQFSTMGVNSAFNEDFHCYLVSG